MNKVINLVDINNTVYKNTKSLDSKDVSSEYQWTYQQRAMDFSKDLNLKGKYCYHPFNTVTVDGAGDCYVCVCQAWLPISVGNIFEFSSLKEIVQSPKAREIQSTILNGSYRYCDHNTCSIIKEDELKDRIEHRPDNINWINFALDPSCNLSCPSCRNEFQFLKEGPEYDKKIKIVEHLANLIKDHHNWIKFSLSGDGDPFASLIYRHFLSVLDLTKRQNTVEIEIITNGILLKDHWHKLEKIHKNITRTKISLDAGSEKIYNITRRGGNWNKLLENIKFIVDWRKNNKTNMIITSNFVVQTSNYHDMLNYVDMCYELGIDEICFQKIVDWGTFKNFEEHAVWKNNHPEHNNFLNILNSLPKDKVNLTNLSDLKQ